MTSEEKPGPKPSIDLPTQTPLFWAIHKDRYRRQDLIRQIEEHQGRRLIVYFASRRPFGTAINRDDVAPFADLLQDVNQDDDVDLLLQSPGGDIDAAEKIVYMLRKRAGGLRVIVPEGAKSAATLIALAADSIVMGYVSELGPIDPQIIRPGPGGEYDILPAHSFRDGINKLKQEVEEEGSLSPVYYPMLQRLDPAILDYCDKAIERSKQFAIKWLSKYMFKGTPEKAEEVAEKLLNVEEYTSHGTVIDAEEAGDEDKLGLTVESLPPENELWRAIWQLYCMYDVDSRESKLTKIFESNRVSISMSG